VSEREPDDVRQPVGPDGQPLVTDAEADAADRAADEIRAAQEREADLKAVDLGAGFKERLIASITGASLRLTALAFVLAIGIGAVILALSDAGVQEALGYFFDRPSDTFTRSWAVISASYGALFRGAVGSPRAITETLVSSAPLILTGLAVAIPLRAGLFNIGGEGQVIGGAIVSGYLGFTLTGLPLVVHLPIAIVGGVLGGLAVGFIPGILKARTGAHEVITTIMLNNMLQRGIIFWLLTTAAFQNPGRSDPVSQNVLPSASLPRLVEGLRGDIGIFLALLVALWAFWLMERSTRGFELNAVGRNPTAATAAGMSPGNATVFAMTTAGALAGLAGALIVLGVDGRITTGVAAGVGFDGITVALLGRGGIGGSVAAGLLLGGLKAGGRSMQGATQVSLDLIVVIQALIIVFIAAPRLVQAIFRLKTIDEGTAQISKGWGA
jgi:general nucleoside transport system permease protein